MLLDDAVDAFSQGCILTSDELLPFIIHSAANAMRTAAERGSEGGKTVRWNLEW